jgi:protein-tyrosine phosphatase family protein
LHGKHAVINHLRSYRIEAIGLLVAVGVLLAGASTALADLHLRRLTPNISYGKPPKTDADYANLQKQGIRTVVDVRKFLRRKMYREQQRLAARGIAYVQVATGFRPQRTGDIERAYRVLVNSGLYPVYMHCNLGKDRSSLLVGLYRVRAQGWSPQAAYAEMRSNRFSWWLRKLRLYFWAHARG